MPGGTLFSSLLSYIASGAFPVTRTELLSNGGIRRYYCMYGPDCNLRLSPPRVSNNHWETYIDFYPGEFMPSIWAGLEFQFPQGVIFPPSGTLPPDPSDPDPPRRHRNPYGAYREIGTWIPRLPGDIARPMPSFNPIYSASIDPTTSGLWAGGFRGRNVSQDGSRNIVISRRPVDITAWAKADLLFIVTLESDEFQNINETGNQSFNFVGGIFSSQSNSNRVQWNSRYRVSVPNASTYTPDYPIANMTTWLMQAGLEVVLPTFIVADTSSAFYLASQDYSSFSLEAKRPSKVDGQYRFRDSMLIAQNSVIPGTGTNSGMLYDVEYTSGFCVTIPCFVSTNYRGSFSDEPIEISVTGDGMRPVENITTSTTLTVSQSGYSLPTSGNQANTYVFEGTIGTEEEGFRAKPHIFAHSTNSIGVFQ